MMLKDIVHDCNVFNMRPNKSVKYTVCTFGIDPRVPYLVAYAFLMQRHLASQ